MQSKRISTFRFELFATVLWQRARTPAGHLTSGKYEPSKAANCWTQRGRSWNLG